eukprot:GHVH01005327.1.p1 GENE.GHVH01005327.1~~GHVH01005327.1.p1  ORF type:complete len:731 (+),score=77.14 GHVH01005327.1:42-2234(+)
MGNAEQESSCDTSQDVNFDPTSRSTSPSLNEGVVDGRRLGDFSVSDFDSESIERPLHRRCMSSAGNDRIKNMPFTRVDGNCLGDDTSTPSKNKAWLDSMAYFVQSTDPMWFSRLQMDLHFSNAKLRDSIAFADEESSHVYLIKSRYGNLRGVAGKKKLAEIEESGMLDPSYNVQSDDELVGAYQADSWMDDSDDVDPLLLDTMEADLTTTMDLDLDLDWWRRRIVYKRDMPSPEKCLSRHLVPDKTSKRGSMEHSTAGLMGRKQAVLAILKGFVGTGMLFLPHAISQGGLIFSCTILTVVWLASLYSMVLLIDCAEKGPRAKHPPHSFGSLGRAALGKVGNAMVNLSVFMSQLGFCCVYSVFMAKNIEDIISSATGFHIASGVITCALIPILIPMSWIRKLKNLAPAILLANVFVSTASVTIIFIAIGIVALSGPSPGFSSWSNILCNGSTWPLTLGFTLYAWEGIGLVIPIKNSLIPSESNGPRYAKTLSKTMFGILVLYLSFGGLLFLTYGESVNQVILLSLPETPLTVILQVMFTISCLCSFPLQFFPAARIMERLFMSKIIDNTIGVGQLSESMINGLRNGTRALLVLITICVGVIMRERIDLLTSFIGCLCCLPLSLIYPVLFHLVTRKEVKTIGDIESFRLILPRESNVNRLPVRPLNYIVLTFGFVAMLFTGQQTTQALIEYLHPHQGHSTEIPTLPPHITTATLPPHHTDASSTSANQRTQE